MAFPHHHHLQKPEERPPPPHVRPPFDPHNHKQPPPPPPPHVIRPIIDHHQPAPPPPHVILSLDPHPPPPPPSPPHVFDHLHPPGGPGHPPPPPLADHKPTFRVYTKAETHFSLTIRHGKVVLAPLNPADPFQHWFKEEKYSRIVKDEEGFPSFALVNKATGQAIKHSIGATHPVQLIPYNPDRVDESVLWTLSKDLGDGYRTIRMVNNIRLTMDAFNGDANHGGVRDGTIVVLWEWKKGPNQLWNIISY